MKKIAAVFLLFVSFTVFAQKQEIGKLLIELRDYDREWRPIPEDAKGDAYKEFEVHITNTVPEKYIEFQEYLNRWLDGRGMHVQRFPNKRILITNYRVTEEGRWRPLRIFFPLLLGQNPSDIDSTAYNKYSAFDVAAELITKELNKRYPGTFSWATNFRLVFNDEEYYWLMQRTRTDEKGNTFYGFKTEFIFYKE
jgi:hypothetical protein